MARSTVIVAGHMLLDEVRLISSRTGTGSGLQVMPIGELAERLAGGFLSEIETEQLGMACRCSPPPKT
jgi:hypothetical protein